MTNTVVLPKRKRRPVDKTLPVIMTLLLMMGLVTLFSATYYNAQDSGDALSEVKKQLFGMAVGFAAMLFTSRIPYWFWGRHRVALAGLGLSAVLLVLVIIPGVGVYINGSRRWLRLGPLSFQPSELAKYAVVLFVALALAARGKRVQRFFTGILPVLIAPGVMFLLILEQPNLSTAGTIIIVSVILVMLAGARWRHMLVLGAGGLALGAYYAWSEPYRRERLLSFTNPFAKMNDEGYQHRAQQKDRGAHALAQLFRHFPLAERAAADAQRIALPAGFTAQHTQNPAHAFHIPQAWTIGQHGILLGQHAGRQNRQHGVLGGIHPQGSLYLFAAADPKSCHALTSIFHAFMLCRTKNGVQDRLTAQYRLAGSADGQHHAYRRHGDG